MGHKGVIGWVLLTAVILTSAGALYGMMRKRFSTGTTYPPLSSLRADPLGARAIFEAFDDLPGIRAERHFRQLKHLEGAPGKTLFLLNVSHHAFDIHELIDGAAITRFAVDGGRVVITLDAHSRNSLDRSLERALAAVEEQERKNDEEADKDKKADDPEEQANEQAPPEPKETDKPKTQPSQESSKSAEPDASTDGDEAEADRHRPSLAEALKLSITHRPFRLSAKGGAELTAPPASPLSVIPLPEWFSDTTLIPGHESLAENEDSGWEPLAFRSDRVMIAQRLFGTGSVVVCSDSYFMTNEALWTAPASEFLLWLTGGARTLVFDERHLGLGMGDDPGIMNLARRYQMHGLFIGGILLFLLFVWRNSCSLVPHDEDADLGLGRGGVVSGEGASSGLVSLLRRGISKRALLTTCLDAWQATPAVTRRAQDARIAAARSALQSDEGGSTQRKNISTQYEQLTRILHEPSAPPQPPASS